MRYEKLKTYVYYDGDLIFLARDEESNKKYLFYYFGEFLGDEQKHSKFFLITEIEETNLEGILGVNDLTPLISDEVSIRKWFEPRTLLMLTEIISFIRNDKNEIVSSRIDSILVESIQWNEIKDQMPKEGIYLNSDEI